MNSDFEISVMHYQLRQIGFASDNIGKAVFSLGDGRHFIFQAQKNQHTQRIITKVSQLHYFHYFLPLSYDEFVVLYKHIF